MKFFPGQFLFLISVCALVRFASSKVAWRNDERVNCGALNFRCKSGECIESHLLCDGRPDCRDKSDETRDECMRPEIVCPEYAFRCNYGACVDGDSTCNEIDDCIDRSDELLPRCGHSASSNNASCTNNQFMCNNGQCIPRNAICDGTTDCNDRSDETVALCRGVNCPAFSFRCNYGACIDDALKCNGVRNCADGSDEDPNICTGDSTTSTTLRSTISEPSMPARQRCPVPRQPTNGRWRLHKSLCRSEEHCDLPRNSPELDPGTWLVYTCRNGYNIEGTSDVSCGLDGTWSSEPKCVETKCKVLNSASTKANCRLNNDWISCDSPVPPGTTADISCNNGYLPESSVLSTRRDNVGCNAQGQWEPEPIKCSPVCGRVYAKGRPLIVGGTRANASDFPWHATLYKAESPNGKKVFICGATIIKSDLLVTAAHCVFDETTKNLEDASKFYTVAGNLVRDYDSEFHNYSFVERAKVKRIYVNCDYLGLKGNYANDIAVLHLDKKFVFSAVLMPACLDSSYTNDESVLQVGNYGQVAGFGRTERHPTSFFLQNLTVPYVSYDQCRASDTDGENEKFIFTEKFCAGYRNGSAVCNGDSGGGLVFKTNGLWYLRGIVSVGLGSTFVNGIRRCDSHAYSLYTRISRHIRWIQEIILKLELYKEYPTC